MNLFSEWEVKRGKVIGRHRLGFWHVELLEVASWLNLKPPFIQCLHILTHGSQSLPVWNMSTHTFLISTCHLTKCQCTTKTTTIGHHNLEVNVLKESLLTLNSLHFITVCKRLFFCFSSLNDQSINRFVDQQNVHLQLFWWSINHFKSFFFFKQNCQNIVWFQRLRIRICCFSVSRMTANRIPLGFVGHTKQF